jgi:hypothetical protein
MGMALRSRDDWFEHYRSNQWRVQPLTLGPSTFKVSSMAGLLDHVLARLAAEELAGFEAALWWEDHVIRDPERRRAMAFGQRPMMVWPDSAPLDAPAELPAWAVADWRSDAVLRLSVTPPRGDESWPPLSSAEASRQLARRAAVHTPVQAYRYSWGWPLRIAAVGPSARRWVDAMNSVSYLQRLFEATAFPSELPAGGRFELLLVADDVRPFEPNGARCSAVIMVGHGAIATAQSFERGELSDWIFHGLLAAGAGFMATDADAWFERLVRELSHNKPLDVALAEADADSVLFADPYWLEVTSLRTLAMRWQQRVDSDSMVDVPQSLQRFNVPAGLIAMRDLATRMVEVSLHESYNSEGEIADAQAAVSAHERVEVEERVAMAAVDDGRGAGDETPPDETPPGETPPPRFVNVRVSAHTAAGDVSDDEVLTFVRGTTYRIGVAVRAKRAQGAQALNQALALPDVARQTLTVVVFPRGRMDQAQRQTVDVIGSGDSPWVDFDVTAPGNGDSFDIVVGVFGDGPLQAGLISGALVGDEATAASGAGWQLSLAGLGVLGVADGTPAVMVDDAAGSNTQTLTLTPGQVQSAAVAGGKQALRDQLLAALKAEGARPSLKRLAATLAPLAIDGRLLRDQLVGAGPSPFDAASTVRVFSSEAGDPLPLEAVYDHAAPVNGSVPICKPALGRATECTSTCASRNDSSVVCPFGFWGVSKVVERVRATRGDHGGSAVPGAPRIAVSRGAVVGLSKQVNGADPRAGAKIAKALRGVVGKRLASTTTWTAWDDAVAIGAPLLALVTHTDQVDGRPALEVGGELRSLHLLQPANINPAGLVPGPLVLLLGCDTAHVAANYTNVVDRLHAVGADVVVSMQTPVRGSQVARLVDVLGRRLEEELAGATGARVGSVLRGTRAELLKQGRIVGLALLATGDGGIELE